MFTKFKKFISKQFIFPEVIIPVSDDLSGKVVLVTGAGKGIGKAIVDVMVKKGANVVAVSRSIDDLADLEPQDEERLLILKADVTVEGDVARTVREAIAHYGRIDVLVNNVGINMEKPLEDTTIGEFDAIVNTNIKSAFLMSKHVIPGMKKAGNGLIVNIGSKISHNTNVSGNKVLYATTKHAIEGFSFALNRELKPAGIRVSCLMPGTVNTFVSMKADQFLSPYHVAELITTMIRLDDIDFESLIVKSKKQNI